MKFKVLLLAWSIFIVSCSTVDPDYVDDNYSDRWELAIKMLGEQVVYFDASEYESKEAQIVESTSTGTTKKSRFSAGISDDLVFELKAIVDARLDRIAISGNSSDKSAEILADALSHFNSGELSDINILFIGNEKFKDKLKKLVEGKGGIFLFAEKPKTTI